MIKISKGIHGLKVLIPPLLILRVSFVLNVKVVGHKASMCPNRRNIVLVEGDLYFLGDKVTKNDVSEGMPHENDGEPERVVKEGEVNVPCGMMRRAPHDNAWPEEGEVLIPI